MLLHLALLALPYYLITSLFFTLYRVPGLIYVSIHISIPGLNSSDIDIDVGEEVMYAMVRRSERKISTWRKVRTKAFMPVQREVDTISAGGRLDKTVSWAPEKDIVIIGARVFHFVPGSAGNIACFESSVKIDRNVSASWYNDYRIYDDGILFQKDAYDPAHGSMLVDEFFWPQSGNEPLGMLVEEGELIFIHCSVYNCSGSDNAMTICVELHYVELE